MYVFKKKKIPDTIITDTKHSVMKSEYKMNKYFSLYMRISDKDVKQIVSV